MSNRNVYSMYRHSKNVIMHNKWQKHHHAHFLERVTLHEAKQSCKKNEVRLYSGCADDIKGFACAVDGRRNESFLEKRHPHGTVGRARAQAINNTVFRFVAAFSRHSPSFSRQASNGQSTVLHQRHIDLVKSAAVLFAMLLLQMLLHYCDILFF